MANSDVKISELTQTSLLSNTDVFVVARGIGGSPSTNTIPLSALRTQIPVLNTPANSSALTISSGTLLYDSSYLYIAVANNVVKRVALSSF